MREGWAWPVVVIPPQGGWDTDAGESVKYAMRLAEKALSTRRDAVRGFEVTFMFANIRGAKDLPAKVKEWRGMKCGAIVSFGDGAVNAELARLCAVSGPSVIYAYGEDLAIKDASGSPYPYLFALDFTYFARANALAALATNENQLRSIAVITDRTSDKLAKGAAKNVAMLRKHGLEVLPMYVSAMRTLPLDIQVQTAAGSDAGVLTCWLDGMSAVSVWRAAENMPNRGMKVYYSGGKNNFLLDAEGLMLVDKDDVLNLDEAGHKLLKLSISDALNKNVKDNVMAARAYALAKWVVFAYENSQSADALSISRALSVAKEIPLSSEILSINPKTHRPEARKYAVLKVQGRKYVMVGTVNVYSEEIIE
ncbi:hypothetical protein FACS1894167_12590 [Synergistales bacterium]|nr:hypothetical protein FACS1894167_12590 [Synergistales bacterium]